MRTNIFTIILCTYNGERTLNKALKKISEQVDYQKYVKQFIVVDNASTDGTKSIIKNFMKQFPDVIYSYESRSGLSYARLNGVRKASGEWIVFIDDDNELEKHWIKNAYEYITKNPDVSLFGGSIIPKFEFVLSEEETRNLEAAYHMLACTDLCKENIDYKRRTCSMVVGAGMAVKNEILQSLADEGWLRLTGRCKSNTASGEDNEINDYVVKKLKKKRGFCPILLIEHNLPRERLQAEYLIKLQCGITEGRYRMQSNKKWYLLRRIKSVCLILCERKSAEGTFQQRLRCVENKRYMELLLQDAFVLKRNI